MQFFQKTLFTLTKLLSEYFLGGGDRTHRGWGAGVCDRGRGGGLRENTLEQVGTISYEGNLLGMNCLLHSFDSRQDVSA